MDTVVTFTLESKDSASAARAGILNTTHGVVKTPVFMPVGTQASVKALSQEDLLSINAPIILSNAYHLYLRPGVDIIREAGGLHRFMNWERPILTDSGGFQVFSLAKMAKVTLDGVQFQSHIDGSRHFLTPESAIKIQVALGADIIMCFDECTSYPVSREDAEHSMRMTLEWAFRCKKQWEEENSLKQALFGIIQGSVYRELREESTRCMVDMDFPGYAIGGVSVGESKKEMFDAVSWCVPGLPENRPRYLMGVGTPEDLLMGIELGIDMFDCVMPSRIARNGHLFTRKGRINIKNNQYRRDFSPVDESCSCPVCQRYTRAYLAHLFRAGEISALRLNTLHNLFFMVKLAAIARVAIEQGNFVAFKESFLASYHNEG